MAGTRFYFLYLVAAVALFSTSSLAKRKRYDGYRVIRLETSEQTNEKISVILRKYLLDVWRRPSVAMRSYDVMISPRDWKEISEAFDAVGANYTTTISNVQDLIDAERGTKNRQSRRRGRRLALPRYRTFREIKLWMKSFTRYNRDIVKLVQVGVSYEGRRILALKIGVPAANSTKRILWQDAGIHAREWVTISTLIWVSRTLVAGFRANDSEIVRFLNRMDWYILPVWNVDGYIYTWTKDRMWRKSRSTIGSYGCFGVDLNRNFQTPSRGRGTSSDYPCSEVYHGPYAFSEIESSSLREYMTSKKSQLAAVLTLHSYAQYWLYPYGYTENWSEDHGELENLSIHAVTAMKKKHGTVYKQGTVSELAYIVAGGSIDWSYINLCVKYTFGIELRDTGFHGFALPPSLIRPTAEEYFEGVKVVAHHVMEDTDDGLTSSVCREGGRRG